MSQDLLIYSHSMLTMSSTLVQQVIGSQLFLALSTFSSHVQILFSLFQDFLDLKVNSLDQLQSVW